MARLEDIIDEISDSNLRRVISEEVVRLKKRTTFGIVFEGHEHELVPLYGHEIKLGDYVALVREISRKLCV